MNATRTQGILVTISKTQGSTPRNVGATLWVSLDETMGSIGGGQMEADAVRHARALLHAQTHDAHMDITLGPKIGQCCGVQVSLSFEPGEKPGREARNLAIFGAGHVGSQLGRLAGALGLNVQIFDNREEIEIENGIPYTHLAQPERQIARLAAASHIVILTHDHGLDFRLAEAALLREDLGFVGMIGSKSKAARFRLEFAALGERLAKLRSPIAKTSPNKHPASIALHVLGEILDFEYEQENALQGFSI